MFKIISSVIAIGLIASSCQETERYSQTEFGDSKVKVYIELGIEDDKVSSTWLSALERRETIEYRDSLGRLSRPLTDEEMNWSNLISSRTDFWSQILDSLQVPFKGVQITDTIRVLLGYRGDDDGFTFNFNTVCFDLSALHRAYGSAKDSINTNRMDRIFAHEYTHLLSKEWARQTDLQLQTFQDSIRWECIYEGIGMYRSMSSKWFPVAESLSGTSAETFETLYPRFADRMIAIQNLKKPGEDEKRRLHKNLSAGSMKQKWGALPVAVWLAFEAAGDDRNLRKWVNLGPDAIIPLAMKYLTGEEGDRFREEFNGVVR